MDFDDYPSRVGLNDLVEEYGRFVQIAEEYNDVSRKYDSCLDKNSLNEDFDPSNTNIQESRISFPAFTPHRRKTELRRRKTERKRNQYTRQHGG